jgi:hypothetical protein
MSQQYLLPKARSSSGQTVKQQDLTGVRYTLQQRAICQQQADKLAESMSQRTGQQWTGFVEAYTPTVRKT